MSNLGPSLTVVASIALGITTIAAFLRFHVRICLQRRFAADDYLLLFSLANFVGLVFCILRGAKYGIGNHLHGILVENPRSLSKAMLYWYIAQTFYIASICTVKFTIAIFFYSLRPARALRIAAICTVFLSAISGICIEMYHIFHCAPISYFWRRFNLNAKGSCLKLDTAFVYLEVFNSLDLLTDIALSVIACTIVWNLKTGKAKRFGVFVLLGLSMLCAACPFARAFYIKPMLFNRDDFTHTAYPFTITILIEPAIAITLISLAHLHPLTKQILPSRRAALPNKQRLRQNIPFGCPATLNRKTLGVLDSHDSKQSFQDSRARSSREGTAPRGPSAGGSDDINDDRRSRYNFDGIIEFTNVQPFVPAHLGSGRYL